jgi:hypothetical protein
MGLSAYSIAPILPSYSIRQDSRKPIGYFTFLIKKWFSNTTSSDESHTKVTKVTKDSTYHIVPFQSTALTDIMDVKGRSVSILEKVMSNASEDIEIEACKHHRVRTSIDIAIRHRF